MQGPIDYRGHLRYLYRKLQSTYLTGQAISKLQIPMTKKFQPLIRGLAAILSVLNFEFRSLEFIWSL